MAQEYLLVVAGACLLGAITLQVHRVLRARAYPARHTAEQKPVEHHGVTETSPRLVDLPLAPPPPPIDPQILLKEAKAKRVRLDREIAELEARVEAEDNDRLHTSLERLERHFKEQLARAGQRDIPTAELRRADIRRIVRSGAPR